MTQRVPTATGSNISIFDIIIYYLYQTSLRDGNMHLMLFQHQLPSSLTVKLDLLLFPFLKLSMKLLSW